MEQIAIFLPDHVLAITFDSVTEVKKDGKTGITHAIPGITSFLRGARRNVSWGKISE
jgi:hypothetical protein